LFVNRQRKSDVALLGPAFKHVVDQGVPLVLFPEGTSTGGDQVLPFMPSLLEPAAQHGWTVTPAWIGYSLAHGSVADQIAYWRDMTFLPHFLNLLSLPEIEAKVVFRPAAPAGLDRKRLAKLLRDEVEETARQNGAIARPPVSISVLT
jgi:1-acyl-sn-glycerol-3-phosphate acyltransferase